MSITSIHRFGLATLAAALVIAAAGCNANLSRTWRADRRASADDELTAQFSVARLNERQGQHEQARKIYQSLLQRNPKSQLAHHRLGVMAAREARLAEADEHFQRAAQVAQPTAELLSDMGYNLYLQDRLPEAEEAYRAALKRDPQNQRAENNLGLVLGEMGRTDESLASFRKAVGEPQAQANLAYARTQVGDLQGAEKHYHKALALDATQRNSAEALIQLAGMKLSLQRAHSTAERIAASAEQNTSTEPAETSPPPSSSSPRPAMARSAPPASRSRFTVTDMPAEADPASPAKYRPQALAALHARNAELRVAAAPPGSSLADTNPLRRPVDAQSQPGPADVRQASHVEIDLGGGGSASSAAPRIPSLPSRLPARRSLDASQDAPQQETLPEDVPMHGPATEGPASEDAAPNRRNSSPMPGSAGAAKSRLPSDSLRQISPWQHPTWTAATVDGLKAPPPLSSAASPSTATTP